MANLTEGGRTFAIRIGNRRLGDQGEYVGRKGPWGPGSLLANPYSRGTRDDNCDAYERWFAEMLAASEKAQPGFFRELRRLGALHHKGDLVLVCWCAPARCHAETIRRWLEREDR